MTIGLAVMREKRSLDYDRDSRGWRWRLNTGANQPGGHPYDSRRCVRLCCCCCYCCLLTDCCLCLPLARRTSGDDWVDEKKLLVDAATRASILANGLEAIHQYIWTDIGICSGLLQQICRSCEEGHAHLRTQRPQSWYCHHCLRQVRKCCPGRA
jgi:hypothetical protein